MEFPLKDQTIFDLSNLHRGTRDKKVADKLKCIKLLNQHESQTYISELLEIDEKTVYNWRKEYLEANSLEIFITGRLGNHKGKFDDEKKTSY